MNARNTHPDHALVACESLPNSQWRIEYGPRCLPRPCRHPKHGIKGCGCGAATCRPA